MKGPRPTLFLTLASLTRKVVFLLQKELERFFPDQETLKQHEEIIAFSCGLTAQTQFTLSYVYDTLLDASYDNPHEVVNSSFLKMLWREVSEREVRRTEELARIPHTWEDDRFNELVRSEIQQDDMKLNEQVAVYEDGELSSFVPSRRYLFGSSRTQRARAIVHLGIVHMASGAPGGAPGWWNGWSDRIEATVRAGMEAHPVPPSAECYIMPSEELPLSRILSVMKIISQYQQLTVKCLNLPSPRLLFKKCYLAFKEENPDDESVQKMHRMFQELVQIDKNITTVHWGIFGETNDRDWTKMSLEQLYNATAGRLWTLISQQLVSHGSLLRLKSLAVPMQVIGVVGVLDLLDHTHLPVLETLDLSQQKVTRSASKEGLNQTVDDKKLGKLSDLFGGTKAGNLGFPSLKRLFLGRTDPSPADLQALALAVREKKLPKLQELSLDGNELTDSLHELFGGSDHPGFPTLEILSLVDTSLSTTDINCLSNSVQSGKLPELKQLNLSKNRVAGLLSELLRCSKPDQFSFPSLEVLNISETEVTESDKQCVKAAVAAGILPNVQWVDPEAYVWNITKICEKANSEPGVNVEKQDSYYAEKILHYEIEDRGDWTERRVKLEYVAPPGGKKWLLIQQNRQLNYNPWGGGTLWPRDLHGMVWNEEEGRLVLKPRKPPPAFL